MCSTLWLYIDFESGGADGPVQRSRPIGGGRLGGACGRTLSERHLSRIKALKACQGLARIQSQRNNCKTCYKYQPLIFLARIGQKDVHEIAIADKFAAAVHDGRRFNSIRKQRKIMLHPGNVRNGPKRLGLISALITTFPIR